MSRAAFCSLVAAALALALVLRLAALDARPMHHDEANQAIRFGLLLEDGEYRYDRTDHHGPTLYYLTLPFAWVRGQTRLASLDEWTLRIVPVAFGIGTILLFTLLVGGLGRSAVVVAATLAALSPPLAYYNRFYIQESLFVFFTLGFLVALGRYVLGPRPGRAILAGAFAGLAYSTKETSVIVLAAGCAACAVAWWMARPDSTAPHASSRSGAFPDRVVHAAAAVAAAAGVAVLFYSSFFRNLPGVLESVRAFRVYVERGVQPATHVGPWDYYLRTLSWSSSGGLVWTEGLVLILALAGIAHALRARHAAFWPAFICIYALVTAFIFSLIPYKTPWNVLPFYIGFVLLAGSGAAALLDTAGAGWRRTLLVVVLVAASAHLGVQDWRASVRYPADPRNPYAYAQTVPDMLRLRTRVASLAACHPDGPNTLVKVIAGPYEQWPLPWYLRGMKRVGYWPTAADAGTLPGAPIVIASQANANAIEAAAGDGYVSEFYGLRPGVLLTVYVERGLWERFLASRQQ